ncbi:MAG: hypothetical protein KF802_16365 [Bdellovibrionaceae bacterium]|jgi:hypothetical protein|nr:hypothetical protein [Pseudobdellovibrionaceae bacterium]
MSEPTEIEKKLLARLEELSSRLGPSIQINAEYSALENIYDELVERRLRAEYLGQSSITGRNPHEERID